MRPTTVALGRARLRASAHAVRIAVAASEVSTLTKKGRSYE